MKQTIGLRLVVAILAASALVVFLMSAAPVFSQAVVIENPPAQRQVPALQVTITPTLSSPDIETQVLDQSDTPTSEDIATPAVAEQSDGAATYEVDFNQLGYDEVVLNSPVGKAEYELNLPSNWQLQEGSVVEFDISFQYVSFEPAGELPANFGQLRVTVDGKTVETFAIEAPELDHVQIQAALPAWSGDDATQLQQRQRIELIFDVGVCQLTHKATLIVHPTSYFSLNFVELPLAPDLSTYPSPLFQRSFEPDSIVFALPSQPSPAEAAGAVSIAAKLGELTGNRMVISSTLDVGLVDNLSTAAANFDRHLLVVGQPQNNQMMPLLNQIAELPVRLHERQLSLTTQGPVNVSPGQPFTYAFSVTNTSDDMRNLALVDELPASAEFVDCTPQCETEPTAGIITWSDLTLAPAETETFSLTLKGTEIITVSSIENIVTLVDTDLGPINADTFLSEISAEEADEQQKQVSSHDTSDFFFTVDGNAVAENDGIVQEVVSPWNQNRAVLIVTGLNDEAIKKAGQAISSEARFPGMRGAFAVVRDTLPPLPEFKTTVANEISLEDLGYGEEVVQDRLNRRINYTFFIPPTWKLTEDAYVNFRFSHSQPVAGIDATLTVLFNNTPIGSATLGENSALAGSIQANLPATAAEPGGLNRLTAEIAVTSNGEGCQSLQQGFWFVAKSSSKVFLDHSQETGTILALNNYPFPFSQQGSLADLLFLLPANPTMTEWQHTLTLAAAVGSDAGGQTILPAVALGEDALNDELADFHIIAIGRPVRNPFIQEINSALPQPFFPGSDEILQQIDDVIFRLPAGLDLGYLQLLPSPLNEERAVLVVTGTTDDGLRWAVETLASGRTGRLKGDLALVQETGVESIDTRQPTAQAISAIVSTAVPDESVAIATTTPAAVASIATPQSGQGSSSSDPIPQNFARPDQPVWLIPLVALTALVVLGIFAIAYIQTKRQQR